jgi:hypothetical protein
MRTARSFATFTIAMTLLGSFATTRAGSVVVLNNLDQPPQPTGSSPFVGQSFIAGAPQELHGAQMQLDPTAPPSSNITLEVEARNADGTVGQTLFSDFSSSYNPRSGLVKFLADAPFDFAANTGYWLVLSDPTKGSLTWEFTASQVYQSDLGYGLPSFNTAYYSDQDNGMGNALYFQPSDGPQMFDLITFPVVGEPSSLVLMGLAVAIGVLAMHLQSSRFSWRQRPRVARGTKVVHP